MAAKKLATRLGVSATPVREALVALEQVGMVELMHNRGALIKPFGRRELREIYHVRRILEVEGTRLACGRCDAELIQEFRAATEQILGRTPIAESDGQWTAEAIALDTRFHAALADHCGNARLIDELARYRLLGEALLDMMASDHQKHRAAIEIHLTILDALAKNKPEEAAQSMGRHIDAAARMAEDVIFDGRP